MYYIFSEINGLDCILFSLLALPLPSLRFEVLLLLDHLYSPLSTNINAVSVIPNIFITSLRKPSRLVMRGFGQLVQLLSLPVTRQSTAHAHSQRLMVMTSFYYLFGNLTWL